MTTDPTCKRYRREPVAMQDRPDPAELRRRARTQLPDAPERAGARAHFRAMGIEPERLAGPIVGIASTWTGTMPCNLNQLELSAHVAEAVTAAGGGAPPVHTNAGSPKPAPG